MKSNCKSLRVLLSALLLAVQPLSAQFKPALPGYHFQFPRDYFSHPGYQTEWWYYTGNLRSSGGRNFGFELTFFREGVDRKSALDSAWNLRDLYVAHFAISDLDGQEFLHTERANRSGPGIAGADAQSHQVWNGNWRVTWKDGGEHLFAIADGFSIDLNLQPLKPPVVHGENGVSQKSAAEGRASHYFSETRLRAAGRLETGPREYEVTGLAWMDHEFFTQQLGANQQGWDWFSLQLDDGTELMLFQLRRRDGSIDSHSAGTFVDTRGISRQLNVREFELQPVAGETWTSPETQATYPTRWKIRVPALGISVEASTLLASQEFTVSGKLMPNYWEGAIQLTGTKPGAALRGSGYMEMTGYDQKVPMP